MLRLRARCVLSEVISRRHVVGVNVGNTLGARDDRDAFGKRVGGAVDDK